MRLINRKMQTRLMNRKVDYFNGGFVSLLGYLLFFLVFGNILMYIMG